jgi:hypothetical protein
MRASRVGEVLILFNREEANQVAPLFRSDCRQLCSTRVFLAGWVEAGAVSSGRCASSREELEWTVVRRGFVKPLLVLLLEDEGAWWRGGPVSRKAVLIDPPSDRRLPFFWA